MYRQHSLTGKSSETLALQNKNKHKTLFNCFMTSHAFQKVTLQNADNSELNFLGWKKWRQQKPDHRRVLGQHLQVPLPRKRQASAATRWTFAVPPGRGGSRDMAFASPIFGTAGEALPRGFFGSLSAFFFGSPAPKPTNLPVERTAKDMQRLSYNQFWGVERLQVENVK